MTFLFLVAAGHVSRAQTGTLTISGRTYNDVNDNKTLDAVDYAKSIKVNLRSATGTLLKSSGSSAASGFTFSVSPGTYILEAVAPMGFDPSNAIAGTNAVRLSASRVQVTLSGTQTSSGNNFLVTTHGLAILCGQVWNDLNLDGIHESNEPRIAGALISVYDSTGKLVAHTTSVVTFPGWDVMVPPGTYTVVITPPAGYYSTAAYIGSRRMPDPTTITVTVKSPDLHSGLGFLIGKQGQPAEICIGGTVYNDLNGDGIHQAGEPVLPDVTVHLFHADGSPVTSTTTDNVGAYMFSHLPSDNYMVTVVVPSGWSATNAIPVLSAEKVNSTTLKVIGIASNDCLGGDFLLVKKNTGSPFTTFTMGGWGAPPNGDNAGQLLVDHFQMLFPNGVVIGGKYTLTFTSAAAIEAFLPSGTTAGVLRKSYVNPTDTTEAGVFASQVLALDLSVAFSRAGVFHSGLGDLTVQSGPLQGWTVGEVLALANTVLGGNTSVLPAGVTVPMLNDVVTKINENFDEGTHNGGYVR